MLPASCPAISLQIHTHISRLPAGDTSITHNIHLHTTCPSTHLQDVFGCLLDHPHHITMIYFADSVLEAWPHHEWKHEEVVPQDESEKRLLDGSPQATPFAVQRHKPNCSRHTYERTSIGSRVASKITTVFTRS